MKDTSKEMILEQVHTYLQTASQSDLNTLSLILHNLKQKKATDSSYLSAVINMNNTNPSSTELEMTIPINPIIHNSLNMVHGGITATLADSAMGKLVHEQLPEHLTAVTTNLSIQYIRPGTGKFLTCKASVTHQGKQLCVAEAKVHNDQHKLIATANATFAVIKKSK